MSDKLNPYNFISQQFVKTYDEMEELHCTMIDRDNMLNELKKYSKIKKNKIYGIFGLNYLSL
tara:strand:+ start:224 stop:409 length:186 start_codon:yes stop_codon:yes gene_type:complete